jgi:ubiquitin carboxyl-terminal hydrolase 25/28
MARPIDGPDFLSTYLSDSMRPQKGKARIPLLNRKFLKTFGKDCNELLTYLGFTYEVEIADDGTEVEAYYLPRPPPASDPLEHETQRTIIEDAQVELGALILSWPDAERSGVRHPLNAPQPAFKLIERVLACEDYKKRPLSGTRSASDEEDHPYYAGLGAVGDFADSLLLFSYTRQVVVDPINSTYYFECLQDLAVGRKSEILNTQVAILASQGVSNRKDVANAYRFIGMDPGHAYMLTDDHIIGQFKSRLQDIGPAAVEETRNALRIIGNARNSDRIRQAASNAIETYEQALGWLGLDDNVQDEYITAMYGMKVGDNPSDTEIARKAVEIIADYRKSEVLREFLETGQLGTSTEMDAGEAYALLGITDRTASLDLDTLRMQVEAFSADKPDNKDRYEKAYSVICKDQHNNKSTFSAPPKKTYPLESWPVGCLNIGNTCYLNSVLQFLFTIKPLREIVLDCDQHFEEATPKALEAKRVGRSEVTVEKVERAQQCEYNRILPEFSY